MSEWTKQDQVWAMTQGFRLAKAANGRIFAQRAKASGGLLEVDVLPEQVFTTDEEVWWWILKSRKTHEGAQKAYDLIRSQDPPGEDCEGCERGGRTLHNVTTLSTSVKLCPSCIRARLAQLIAVADVGAVEQVFPKPEPAEVLLTCQVEVTIPGAWFDLSVAQFEEKLRALLVVEVAKKETEVRWCEVGESGEEEGEPAALETQEPVASGEGEEEGEEEGVEAVGTIEEQALALLAARETVN